MNIINTTTQELLQSGQEVLSHTSGKEVTSPINISIPVNNDEFLLLLIGAVLFGIIILLALLVCYYMIKNRFEQLARVSYYWTRHNEEN